MTRTTPELEPPLSLNFRSTPAVGHFAPTYDLTRNRPNTRRIFSGIGSRSCLDLLPQSRDLTTRIPLLKFFFAKSQCRKAFCELPHRQGLNDKSAKAFPHKPFRKPLPQGLRRKAFYEPPVPSCVN
ncbi:hypothetical protein AVEN_216003-1 [Araneus ventricosus]|uniref:Uncharacterized protein n=1 Tax=Araneus ventricosus TaxID=182803 RepID=A0A4Y2Q2P4_ARAVE|nr:hypothetical protein AVEN_216003-1 [Araneus ventricosus]